MIRQGMLGALLVLLLFAAAGGRATAHPLDYGKPRTARWSTMLDDLLVLREERPPTFVRKATPQQVERQPPVHLPHRRDGEPRAVSTIPVTG
ncbi:hypothetical protein [Rhodanobacter ginsengiterrae]|uniref:hypothetical protein n=1 Tax=Rhodanobacter ginsengiterrae TaxID=2008451 RepID=UPI003CF583E7